MIEIKDRKKFSWRDLYAAELTRLAEIVAADATNRTGSFSARNPILGKMKTCPHCGRRARKSVRAGKITWMTGQGPMEVSYSLPCCNSKLTPTVISDDHEYKPNFISSNKWKWNDELKRFELPEREKFPPQFRKRGRMKPRLTRNRPPLFEMHDLIKRLEGEEDLHTAGEIQDSIEGLPGFWTPQKPIQREHLAIFAERVITRKKKMLARQKRQQRQLARRINLEVSRRRT